jgi:hypothetical protein
MMVLLDLACYTKASGQKVRAKVLLLVVFLRFSSIIIWGSMVDQITTMLPTASTLPCCHAATAALPLPPQQRHIASRHQAAAAAATAVTCCTAATAAALPPPPPP